MVLLDWTRMGRLYCLAGAIAEKGTYRIVRPLLSRYKTAPVRNAGWSPYLLDGHGRSEIFELIAPEPAALQPPHVEDVWVRAMRSGRTLAPIEKRRQILNATLVAKDESIFGISLTSTYSAAYLRPRDGLRSLVTIAVPADRISFAAVRRQGAPEIDIRANLALPEVGERSLPVKDHFLLKAAEASGSTPDEQAALLNQAVRRWGDPVAVRVGFSRSFQSSSDRPGQCWLMADGFFSFSDPQP
jgi:hypothetical protein